MSKTHDYTNGTWGHDCNILNVLDGGQRLRASGWGRGISAGDYILLKNGEGSTRYQVSSIGYRLDPGDMWFADLHFAPRTQEAAHHD